jgi:hypothetical protein
MMVADGEDSDTVLIMNFFIDTVETNWTWFIALAALGIAATLYRLFEYFVSIAVAFGVSKIIDIHRKVLDL